AGLDAAAGTQVGADMFECPSCQRSFPAARFAAHMDKCMGLSSRRAATRSGEQRIIDAGARCGLREQQQHRTAQSQIKA
ncbi:hypothetical protein LPJ54_004583, partial [Coemansia sp. RSA 1824]